MMEILCLLCGLVSRLAVERLEAGASGYSAHAHFASSRTNVDAVTCML